MRFSIMQLFWNNAADIPITARATLKEVARLEELGHEVQVLLVDNGSIDATSELLHELARGSSDIVLIRNSVNQGNSRARNQAIGAATGDYLLMLDGDIALLAGTERLAEHLKYHPTCFCVGMHPEVCQNEPTLANVVMPPRLQYTVVSRASLGMLGYHCALTQYGLFPAWPFRHAGIRFDETGPFGGAGWGREDNDLFWRLARLGDGEVHCIDNVSYHHNRNTGKRQLESPSLFDEILGKRIRYYDLRWH